MRLDVSAFSCCDDMIHAIIVTFNPDFAILESEIDSLLPQVARIWVIDNSMDQSVAKWIEACNFDPKVSYFSMGGNMGIGAAQNAGIAKAISCGAQYVLLMDQDSLPEPDMVERLYKAYESSHKSASPVAAVAPSYADSPEIPFSGFFRLGWFRLVCQACSTSQSVIEADFLISSGSLIPVESFNKIGPMAEDFFIDHVDTEWCLRARTKGYRLLGVCGARMNHTLGDTRKRFWFLRWRNVSFHAPFRYYYIFRNSILMQKRSYMPAKWRLVELVRCFKLLVFYSLFSSQRWACLKMMGRGIWDGFCGKTGKIK